MMTAKYPTHARPGDFNVSYLAAVTTMHLLACLAPWTCSWAGVASFLILYLLTGQLGINLGFHRLFSHRSFETSSTVRRSIALMGTLAMQGGPISWVGNHRYHHKEADRPLDPHTPLAGFGWAHFAWTFYEHPILQGFAHRARFARDLAKDPFFRFLDGHFVAINLASMALLLGSGWIFGGFPTGLSMLVWGGALRVVVIWHTTFVVNSVNHLWGYRTYETRDNSRNNTWISLIVFGEGWHNNHHAEPRSASHGHRRFEFDCCFGIIRLFERFGLARRVILPRCWRSAAK